MTGSPLLPRWYALLSALVGGVCLWAAFAPVSIGVLVIPGAALVSASCWRASVRRGLLAGFVSGLAFFVPLLNWLHIIGSDAWLLLSAFCACWFALMGAGIALVTRLRCAAVWVPCVWVLQEALRGSVPWGGFPWGSVSFAASGSPVLAWAPWVSSTGVTWLAVFAGSALVAVLPRPWPRRNAAWIAGALLVIVGGLTLPALPASESSGAVVAVIQGGTPQLGMGAMDVRRAVLDNHVSQTLALAAAVKSGKEAQPDLVVWPENASDLDPFEDASAATAITAAARAVSAPILVGAIVYPPSDPQGLWNSGILWDPVRGPGQRYVKTHPVPFGEYIPLRSLISRVVGRFDRIPRDFRAGDSPGLFTLGGLTFGDAICFEVAYTNVMHDLINGGADFLTVQTNNATYGDTAQPDQQFAIERMRARESGRTLAVAATTGISGFIDASGGVHQSMDQDSVGYLVQPVTTSQSPPPGVRFGTVISATLCGVAVIAIVVAAITRRRRRLPIVIA